MISAIIISKNESLRIRSCLESLSFVDEIIVLDSGSTDNTVETAKRYTPHVYTNTDWQGYGVQKQRALNYATGDWVLHIDSDECVSEALQAELLEVVQEDEADACRVPIQFCFYGQPLKYSQSPKRHARFFKRAGARFSDDVVHEKIILPNGARIKQLTAPIFHDSYLNVSHALHKMNQYSSYSAGIQLKKRQPTSFIMCFIRANWMFFRCFILQRGFMDGRAGLILAIISAEGSFYRGIKQLYPDNRQPAVFEE